DPVVVLKFDADGTTAFRDATTAKVGSSIGIYVNGTLIAKLTVNEAIITGEATITGVEDYAACQELALQIQGGSFPVKLVSVECGLL
ncbi:MAG: protein translocase subunit SecDF, partial [Clostridiales bacterium]|nr:protein translocase subunit SecDF [Clostridiales bacterium]